MAEVTANKQSVLVVDDETDHAEVMSEALARLGYKTEVAHSLAEARQRLDKRKFDVIVTDLIMDGRRDGMALLEQAKQLEPPPPVLMVTAVNDVPTSKEALKHGAYDYIVKPLDLDEFRAQVNRAAEKSQLRKENEVLEAKVLETTGFEGIIGQSAGMQQVIKTARQVANSDIPVLILGESGTGKELIARAIHENSRRRKNRLVALNCAGLAESILEDELFGHVKGSFTGAGTDREGRFEHANHGTLFLDEVGDMPGAMQAKLLRVLENGEVVRLGSNDPRRVDVRLVSATNRDIEQMVADRSFREDLYFRIKGISIRIPPLRERREDIPLLVYFFLKQFTQKHGKEIKGVSPAAQQLLTHYHWPGNVRQLRNAVDTAVVLCEGETIQPQDLPSEIRPAGGGTTAVVVTPVAVSSDGQAPVGNALDNLADFTQQQVEIAHIKAALSRHHGNRELAAKSLGMGERTLYRKIKEYGL
ncbi:MAG: sigma-54 dependent transcriptional regulator [Tepidisphaeraceae bacterium]